MRVGVVANDLGSMKVGVACVYLYSEANAWVMRLQLRKIAETLEGHDYTIFAGANRLNTHLRGELAATRNVVITNLPHYSGEGNREHAFYLDLLLREAASAGCTHLAALDADSFPLMRDWPRHLLGRLSPGMRFAAVLRSENMDTWLPHPSGYFMTADFFREHRPALLPDAAALESVDYKSFLEATRQRVDTGIGYGYALWKSGEPWLRLTRSNVRDYHFLMAGIYGNVFFHLGASAREPTFYRDYRRWPTLRVAAHLYRLMATRPAALWLEKRYRRFNGKVFADVAHRLETDADEFLKELGGDPAASQSRA
jgi:hypothetical protein